MPNRLLPRAHWYAAVAAVVLLHPTVQAQTSGPQSAADRSLGICTAAIRYENAGDLDVSLALAYWSARASRHWHVGDLGRARLDFEQLMRFKRRDAELRLEEL